MAHCPKDVAATFQEQSFAVSFMGLFVLRFVDIFLHIRRPFKVQVVN